VDAILRVQQVTPPLPLTLLLTWAQELRDSEETDFENSFEDYASMETCGSPGGGERAEAEAGEVSLEDGPIQSLSESITQAGIVEALHSVEKLSPGRENRPLVSDKTASLALTHPPIAARTSPPS
jgi:hypothetical protein